MTDEEFERKFADIAAAQRMDDPYWLRAAQIIAANRAIFNATGMR